MYVQNLIRSFIVDCVEDPQATIVRSLPFLVRKNCVLDF